jgi:hypothetical protein
MSLQARRKGNSVVRAYIRMHRDRTSNRSNNRAKPRGRLQGGTLMLQERDLSGTSNHGMFWDPTTPMNSANANVRPAAQDTEPLSLQALLDQFPTFESALQSSMLNLLAFKYEHLLQKLEGYQKLNKGYYKAVRQQWTKELKELGGNTQQGEAAFGSGQVWEILKGQYSEYFVGVKAIQSLRALKAEMETVAGTGANPLAVASTLRVAAAAITNGRRVAKAYHGPIRWAVANTTSLKKAIGSALRKLKGRQRELSVLATMISAFALDWRYGKDQYMNFIIMGPAGTGKTTLARIMGEMLQMAGLVFRRGLVETTRSNYIGQYLGESAPKTLSQLEAARERVLFIDEGYALAKCGKRDTPASACSEWDQYSEEAMTALVAFLSQNIGQIIVIVAGYQTDIEDTFMAINEGIPRRFPNRIVLRPMTDQQLQEVFYSRLKIKGIGQPDSDSKRKVSARAHSYLVKLLSVDRSVKIPKGRGWTTTRRIFKYEASDMVNLANTVFTYMLTRNGGRGVTTLSVCAMQGILNNLVFERTQLYIVPENQCASITQDQPGRRTRSGKTTKARK